MGIFDFFSGKKVSKNSDAVGASDTYPVKAIKEYDSGRVSVTTTSKRWGNDFLLSCKTKEMIPYAKKCLSFLDNMPDDIGKRLRKYLLRYYRELEGFLDDEQRSGFGTVNEDSILNLISIHSVIVDDKCRQDKMDFHVEGACKWEIEHGLEVTFSDGEIIYVGGFGDYGPNTSRLKYHLDKYGYYDPVKDMNENYADCAKVE